jgi:ribulose-bisphosphate carboxylase large chain
MGASLTGSPGRFIVTYRLSGSAAQGRAKAEALCLDQTVETPRKLGPTFPLNRTVLGRLEEFRRSSSALHEARVSFSNDLMGDSCAQFLNVVFGISSLKPGIRVVRLDFPEDLAPRWSGARFGRAGLRARLGIAARPLVCGVLKPLGRPPEALAALARQLALGGLDLIKDDQGLADHPFCPFEERVARCAEAVAQAGRETGRPTLYLAHVTGGQEEMRRRCLFARQAGAGGLLICPGLAGFDALRDTARDEQIGLPVMSHPAFLGSFIIRRDSGIAPAVLFGQLPRLAGADITLYPNFGGPFPMSREDCRRVASAAGGPWGRLIPIFPSAGGRMRLDRIGEMSQFYDGEVVLTLGSDLYRRGPDLRGTCARLMRAVGEAI